VNGSVVFLSFSPIKKRETPKAIVKHQYIIICFTNEINCEINCERNCEINCERNCEIKWNAINQSMTDFFEKVKQ
jgi:hypothetical protein